MNSQKINPPHEPLSLSPCSSGRRTSGDSNSPEFEFWNIVDNPFSFPHQNQLLSADELFVNGFLRIPKQSSTKTPPDPDPNPDPEPEPGSQITRSTANTPSKRWMDIFKKSDKKNEEDIKLEEKKMKKKKNKSGQSGVNSSSASAELNINIWPFRRSRSAGNNNMTRPALGSTTRKVSSAPCSRSNSSGRQWPSSPGRGGVHLGRSSPVWQVKPRGGVNNNSGKKEVTAGSRQGKSTKVMNLNVPLPPMCVGYSQHLSCKSIETGAIDVREISGRRSTIGGGGNVQNSPGNLFNLRSFFSTKKVY